jgi:lysophospholipase L1-like esterase
MGVNAAPVPGDLSGISALAPSPNTQASGYDWHGRHEYIKDEQPSWRSWPRVVLVGDSIAHFWSGMDSIGEIDDSLTLPRWKAAFAGIPALNMGFASDRTQNLIWRLENGAFKNVSPYLIVLMIGRENLISTPTLAESTPEETAQAVRKVIGMLRKRAPAAEIVLMGVLPCGSAKSPLRERISLLNRLLERIPSYGYDGKVSYLDVGGRFTGVNGEIPRTLMPDLIHPSDEGYAILSASLEPYLARVRERIAQDKSR